MSKVLYFDCFSGASGDMILGALIDAGLPIAELREALGSLPLKNIRVEAHTTQRAGIGATKFTVIDETAEHRVGNDNGHHQHRHDAGHSHDHADHRGLTEICRMIDGSGLSTAAKERSNHLFRRLAEVEAAIHQTSVEKVHLHEVGAIDSIIDIAGCVFALEWFDVERIIVSPLNVGSGTVKCEHGVMPVPAPATAKLIEGTPVYSKGPEVELLTPTGALILTDYAESYGSLPTMTLERTGFGAGDHDFPDHPNLLRAVIGQEDDFGALERVVVLECEIDDMNPQIFGLLMDRLYANGALDVFYVPIQMKKNRPGTLVTIVALPPQREALSNIVFRETTTIGVRFREMDRERLDREEVAVETSLGVVRFKLARRSGTDVVVNASPEFEDCVRLAEEHGLPVKTVQAVATKAYLERERT